MASRKKTSKSKPKSKPKAATKRPAKKRPAKKSKAAKPRKPVTSTRPVKRASAPGSTTLERPPLPPLVLTPYSWQGKDTLSSWTGFDFEEPSDGRVDVELKSVDDAPAEPTAAQLAAYDFLKKNEHKITAEILQHVLATYPEQKAAYEEAASAGSSALPEITDTNGLRRIIRLCKVYVHPKERAGVAYVGFGFECAWDEEHGLGIMTHNARVVEVGEEDVAYTTRKDPLA